jgi:two-component system chemotaxis sensor kinase CheA
LNRELKLQAPTHPSDSDVVQMVVLQADGRQFGMVVDQINDTEEIVVKPLGKQLKGISCFAGATIMGDGQVALILDVLGLAQYAKVVSEVRDRCVNEQLKSTQQAGEKQTFLLVEAGANSRIAIALSSVARLEEFARNQVEFSGGQEVVQYRGQILPLIEISQYLPQGTSTVSRDPMQVVVYSEQGCTVGLVVGSISDIVEETLVTKRELAREGFSGSAVIQDRVTDLLDVPGIVRAANRRSVESNGAHL